jgi:hypothetical protein
MQSIRKLVVKHMWWLVLLTSIALLAAHSFGIHRIIIDNTSLILLVIVLFSPFVAAVKKIKIGDFEAEIEPDEVKRVAQQVRESLPETASEMTTEPETRGVSSAIKTLAESDLVVALAKLRIEIESRLRRLLSTVNEDVSSRRPAPLAQIIRKLEATEVFSTDFGAALREVMAICNRAIHGEDIREVDARKIVNTGLELLEAIEQMVRENGLIEPVSVAIIENYERDDYQSSRYRMTTIVPLVDKPERHIYVLTKDELDSFFEGYSEYAEFVVNIEKLE